MGLALIPVKLLVARFVMFLLKVIVSEVFPGLNIYKDQHLPDPIRASCLSDIVFRRLDYWLPFSEFYLRSWLSHIATTSMFWYLQVFYDLGEWLLDTSHWQSAGFWQVDNLLDFIELRNRLSLDTFQRQPASLYAHDPNETEVM